MTPSEKVCKNTDREIWRKVVGDYYSPSIHVTEGGGIGIQVGGIVIVKSVEEWHRIMHNHILPLKPQLPSLWKRLCGWAKGVEG